MSTKGNDSSIHQRLREARELAGLSQGQIAKKLAMHRPTITEIEAGRRKVPGQELEQFARAYGVTVDWIVSGSTTDDSADARMLMAARELSKMRDEDLDRLMKMLKMLRKANP